MENGLIFGIIIYIKEFIIQQHFRMKRILIHKTQCILSEGELVKEVLGYDSENSCELMGLLMNSCEFL